MQREIAPFIDRTQLIPAAQYLRMSTDQQYYSIDTQKKVIGAYAAKRGYNVVATYADAGKSGLSLKGRHGLKQLLSDTLKPERIYEAILVHDISRWGRFRDPDEAAHYEFLCRQAGVAVEYCAEPFENNFSATSGILKNIKRVMAHEFSRELSEKLSRAHRQQARLGYKQGAQILFGFSRLVVDAQDNPKFVLAPGQYKALRTDRVRIALGPPAEQEIVRQIFDLYVHEGYSLQHLARHLQSQNIQTMAGQRMTVARVYSLLKSELCIGLYVYNRTQARLQSPRRTNPEDALIRVPTGTEPLIAEELFRKAQVCLAARNTGRLDPQKLLDDLRRLLKSKGRLSHGLINADPNMATVTAYKNHFGGLKEAYRRIGYSHPMSVTPGGRIWTRESLIAALRALYEANGYISCDLIARTPEIPSYATLARHLGPMAAMWAAIGLSPRTPAEILQEGIERRMERYRASGVRRQGKLNYSQEVLIARLRLLLAEHGYISAPLIKNDPALPSVTTIMVRFGSLLAAYHAVGWNVNRSDLAKLSGPRKSVRRPGVRPCQSGLNSDPALGEHGNA